MATLRTAQVAELAGVNVETLRFYERRGILQEPPRRASGYREYPPDTVERVRFIKRAQELGFTLKEVQDLLELRETTRAKAGRVRKVAEAKLEEIEHKIRDLEAMKKSLTELLSTCDGQKTIASCPIIESLSGCERCRGGDTGRPKKEHSR
ncbi:MAG: MerR family transcriptional regulator [Gemmataceae bacterium]|nr:MerR family transcriptional regulator [Gemmataceae bacterium]